MIHPAAYRVAPFLVGVIVLMSLVSLGRTFKHPAREEPMDLGQMAVAQYCAEQKALAKGDDAVAQAIYKAQVDAGHCKK